MRFGETLFALTALFTAACSTSPDGDDFSAATSGSGSGGGGATIGATTGSGPDSTSASSSSSGDPSASVFDSVSLDNLKADLGQLTGDPVTVGGETYSITERWSPDGKQKFRGFWEQYFKSLGATVNELPFPIPNLVGETTGHNVEAIFPGDSPDTLVIVAHYDTVGVTHHETENPGADDAGSGMATMMEAARIFSQRHRPNTIRFVVADYEEITDSLEGDHAYVDYLKNEAATKGFTILGASNPDQTAWSCWAEDGCSDDDDELPPVETIFSVTTCSGDSMNFSYPQFIDGMQQVASAHGSMALETSCDDEYGSDVSAFWIGGIPGYFVTEYDSDDNPHYDDTGDDTMKHIAWGYYLKISQLEIAYQAKLAGIE